MIEPMHVGELVPLVLADISERVARRRRLDVIFDDLAKAQARIVKIHHEVGPVVEAETRGLPQNQAEVTR